MVYLVPQSNAANFTVSRIVKLLDPLATDFDVNKIAGSFINDLTDLSVFIKVAYTESEDLTSLTRIIDVSTTDLAIEITSYISNNILQVFTKNEYVYAVGGNYIRIFDLMGNQIYQKFINKNIKTIWGNDATLFFGGSTGTYKINYEALHNDYENSIIEYSYLPSTEIKYIHGKDDSLLICTDSTINYFNWSNNPYIESRSNVTNLTKCFLTTNKAYYINTTTISGVEVCNLNIKSNLLTDWEEPTKIYSTGGDIFKSDIYLTDIFITEQTAYNNGNTIFCATTSGIYVIDEDTEEYYIYYAE